MPEEHEEWYDPWEFSEARLGPMSRGGISDGCPRPCSMPCCWGMIPCVAAVGPMGFWPMGFPP